MYKELMIAIIQQAVDDFTWCCKRSYGCIDSRYEEFYFKDNSSRRVKRKNKDIFKSKVEVLNDVRSFFESDWGEIVCYYGIARDSRSIYEALVNNYGIDDSIKRGLEEGVVD